MPQDKKIQVTEDEYHHHVNEYNGVGLKCHDITYGGVEPDAEKYTCDNCIEKAVMGFEQAMICDLLEFTDDLREGY